MGRAIVALTELGQQLRQERPEHSEYFSEVPFVALNLALVHGGKAINIVPDHCRLELGFRLLPGMGVDAVESRLRSCLEEALEGEDWTYHPGSLSPPMLLPEDHDLHHVVRALNGQQETVSASYATDAGWFDQAGFDCLLYGPGDIGVAHKPNEWLPKAEFERCSVDLRRLVSHYCAEDEKRGGQAPSP
jgi:acetylornithine deacetylase